MLALGATNRMLRARDRMRELFNESGKPASSRGPEFLAHVNRVERQALTLMTSLRWIYTAMGAFAAASLVTLLGAAEGELGHAVFMKTLVGVGLLFGFIGVTGIVGGCVHLFHATQLSVENIHEEAELIRTRLKGQA
jgi:hypothetical protein